MSASPQDVSSQVQQDSGAQPTWAQYMALATPPPLDDATINKLEAQIPKPTLLTPPEAPLTPGAEQATKADIASKQASQSDIDRAQIEETKVSGERMERLSEDEIAAMASAQPPAPPQQSANPLQRMAPLLLLTAFGGKASKLDANAMLGATIGTVNGYLQGNEEQYDKATKQYDEAYKRFQDRQKQQTQIFDKLREAYADRADADLKALQMAHQLTEDEITVDQSRLQAQEHWHAAVNEVTKNNDQLKKEDYDERAKLEMQRRKEKAAAIGGDIPDDQLRTLAQTAIRTGHDPAFGMGKSATRDRYNSIKAQEIQRMGGPSAAVGASVATGAQKTEANVVARREAGVISALTPLTQSGGLFDQLKVAADKVDFSDNLLGAKIQLGLAKNIWSNADIRSYAQLMIDVQTDMSQVYSRAGAPTNQTRDLGMDAFPMATSRDALNRQIVTATQAARAVESGNESVLNALTSGLAFPDVAKLAQTGKTDAGARSVTESELKDYAKKQGRSVDEARAFLQSHGYTVQ